MALIVKKVSRREYAHEPIPKQPQTHPKSVLPPTEERYHPPQSSTASVVIALQNTLGNRAVLQLLRNGNLPPTLKSTRPLSTPTAGFVQRDSHVGITFMSPLEVLPDSLLEEVKVPTRPTLSAETKRTVREKQGLTGEIDDNVYRHIIPYETIAEHLRQSLRGKTVINAIKWLETEKNASGH